MTELNHNIYSVSTLSNYMICGHLILLKRVSSGNRRWTWGIIHVFVISWSVCHLEFNASQLITLDDSTSYTWYIYHIYFYRKTPTKVSHLSHKADIQSDGKKNKKPSRVLKQRRKSAPAHSSIHPVALKSPKVQRKSFDYDFSEENELATGAVILNGVQVNQQNLPFLHTCTSIAHLYHNRN